MKEHEMEILKKKLLLQKRNILKDMEANKELMEKSNIKESIGELSTYDNHPADNASEQFEKQKLYAISNHMKKGLKDIEESLNRIREGNYGTCASCGKNINFDRLKAQPMAKLCMDCKDNEMTDSHDGDSFRPVEEEFLKYPFGRTFTDNSDNVVFDGEDAWQDVQNYGNSSGPQDISRNQLIDYENVYYDSDEEIGRVEEIESMDNSVFPQEIHDRKDKFYKDK